MTAVFGAHPNTVKSTVLIFYITDVLLWLSLYHSIDTIDIEYYLIWFCWLWETGQANWCLRPSCRFNLHSVLWLWNNNTWSVWREFTRLEFGELVPDVRPMGLLPSDSLSAVRYIERTFFYSNSGLWFTFRTIRILKILNLKIQHVTCHRAADVMSNLAVTF